jgi:hypothetical protein
VDFLYNMHLLLLLKELCDCVIISLVDFHDLYAELEFLLFTVTILGSG